MMDYNFSYQAQVEFIRILLSGPVQNFNFSKLFDGSVTKFWKTLKLANAKQNIFKNAKLSEC